MKKELSAPVSLRQAFDIRHGEVISLVGGGGKTTLMFALAKELAATGASVITTTTTRILEPSAAQTRLLVATDEAELIRLLLRDVAEHRHITLASERLAPGKLKGISPELVVSLAGLNRLSYIIVEADGAARRPLKAPNPTEPVIPANTSLVIPVVGIDALGCRLTEENVFRSEIAARLLGVPLGEVISAESIALLMTCRQGIIKGSPERAKIIPFINKVEGHKGLARGRDLATKILLVGQPRIKQVVLGQAQSAEPVRAVITREAG